MWVDAQTLAPVALHRRETAVGPHLAVATDFQSVLAALDLQQTVKTKAFERKRGLMPVSFKTRSGSQMSAPWANAYQDIIRQALGDARQDGERWVVTAYQPRDQTAMQFDFALGTEAPRSLTFNPEDDDAGHAVLYRVMSHFLRTQWPGGIRPS